MDRRRLRQVFGSSYSSSSASMFGSSTSSSAASTSSLFGTSFGSTAALPSFGGSSTSAVSSSTRSAAQTSSALVAASSRGTTSTTTAPKLPSEITGKTVQEIIKEWNTELQERTENFQKHANAVAEWDRWILQNRDILLRLETEVAKVVETRGSLERQMELIETHQDEVDKALLSIEEEADRMYRKERGVLLDDDAASTRDAMYGQSELIERELEQMKEHLKSIINALNANQPEVADGLPPLDIAVQILNKQLSSLMWIDEKAEEFSSRIQKLANQGSTADREF